MTQSSAPEPVDLSDPTISPHRLQALAQTHPEQWDDILDHPNVYAGLADWIRSRQAELAATGAAEPSDEPEASQQEHADDAAQSGDDTAQVAQDPGAAETKVFEETLTDAAETRDGQTPGQEAAQEAAAAHRWTVPAGPAPQAGAPTHYPAAQAEPHHWAQSQPAAHHVPVQPSYAPQQFEQQFAPSQQQSAAMNFNTVGPWAVIVAGGAAFLGVFGFFFDASYGTLQTSHVAAGGWIIVLFFIATVVLSLVQLLKPSRWLRFAFLAVSLGAGFMMFARAVTYFGFFTMRGTGFSVVWLLAMSIIILIASLVYLAQHPAAAAATAGTSGPQQSHQPGHHGGYDPGYSQQPGPYGGRGPQSGGYGPTL